MKCQSCSADIPPQWVNAIQQNMCPGCGGSIMDEDTTELLLALSETMQKMPNDPVGLAGWLVSNYYMKKIGDCEPTEFHRAHKVANINPHATPTQQQGKVAQFFKNAGIDLEEKHRLANRTGAPQEMDSQELSSEVYEDDAEINEMMGDTGTFDQGDIHAINSLLENAAPINPIVQNHFEQIKQKQIETQQAVSGGIGAVSPSGKPSGFRRV